MADRRRLAAWSLWGVGPALYTLGTLAVIAAQPVAGQHAVVGVAFLAAPVVGAVGTWALRLLSAPGAAMLAFASIAALLVASWLQGVLGEAWLYQGGHQAAPVLLAAAFQALVVWVALRSSWMVLGLPILLVGAYIGASLAWPEGSSWWLVGGSMIAYGQWLLFALFGALDRGRLGPQTASVAED